jgi:hypothetical protein
VAKPHNLSTLCPLSIDKNPPDYRSSSLTAGSFGTTDVKILYRELVNITCTVIFLHRHASDAGWQPVLSPATEAAQI